MTEPPAGTTAALGKKPSAACDGGGGLGWLAPRSALSLRCDSSSPPPGVPLRSITTKCASPLPPLDTTNVRTGAAATSAARPAPPRLSGSITSPKSKSEGSIRSDDAPQAAASRRAAPWGGSTGGSIPSPCSSSTCRSAAAPPRPTLSRPWADTWPAASAVSAAEPAALQPSLAYGDSGLACEAVLPESGEPTCGGDVDGSSGKQAPKERAAGDEAHAAGRLSERRRSAGGRGLPAPPPSGLPSEGPPRVVPAPAGRGGAAAAGSPSAASRLPNRTAPDSTLAPADHSGAGGAAGEAGGSSPSDPYLQLEV